MGVELPYLWLIEGEKKINERISRMVNHAKNEVILSLSLNRLKLFEQDIIGAVSRGVTVAIVLFSDTPLEEISHLSKRIVVRKDDIRRPRIAEIIISDRSNSLIDMSTLRMGTSYALYYDENQLLHILRPIILSVPVTFPIILMGLSLQTPSMSPVRARPSRIYASMASHANQIVLKVLIWVLVKLWMHFDGDQIK